MVNSIRTASLVLKLVDNLTGPARQAISSLGALTAGLSAFAEKSKLDSAGVTQMTRALNRLSSSKTGLDGVIAAWKEYERAAAAAKASSSWLKEQAEDMRAWERTSVSSLRTVAEEQAALRRALAKPLPAPGGGGGSGGHKTIGGAFRHDIMKNIGPLAVGAGAAGVVIEGGKELVKAGAERQHVTIEAANAGIGPEEYARIQAAAEAAVRGAPNMNVNQVLEIAKEARSAVRNPEDVLGILGDLAKAAAVLKAKGVENADIADIVKGAESLGVMADPKRFHDYLSGQIKSMNVMGKTITSEQIYQADKYSKSAGAVLSDRFLNLILPSIIQELRGSSAGTALSTLTRRLRGGLAHQSEATEKFE